MTDSGLGGGRKPARQGNPQSATCRVCLGPRLMLRGILFCETCDAGQVEGITIRPTWKQRFA